MTDTPPTLPQLPSTLEKNLASETLPRLNGLRAISAFIVIAYHYGFDYVPAGFGVLSFFVISGFLISWLLLKEREQTGSVSLSNFYVRRSLRIFPAFYFYWLLVVIALLATGKSINWSQTWAAFFYSTNYYQGLNGYPSSPFSHTWSLAIEEQFYVLWPAAFIVLARSPQRMFRVLIAVIATIGAYRAVLHVLGAPEEYIYTALDTRIDHLLVGCALAVALKYRLAVPVWKFAAYRGVLFLVITLLTISISCGQIYGISYRNTIGFAVDPWLVALLIVALLSRDNRTTAWMDSKGLVYLGTISYSTYLYQQIVLWPLARTLTSLGTPEPILFVACAVAVWLVASFSYFFIERPFLRLKKYFKRETPGQSKLPETLTHELQPGLASQ